MAKFHEYTKANEYISGLAQEAMEQLKWAVNQGMWHNVDEALLINLGDLVMWMKMGEYDKVIQKVEEMKR